MDHERRPDSNHRSSPWAKCGSCWRLPNDCPHTNPRIFHDFPFFCANFNVVPWPRRHFFNTAFNILTSVLSRLTTWMVNFWHSWRKGDTTPFWCCFLIPSLHRTGANQFPWWTTLKDLKHCTSARVYQYLALRGRKQVIKKSYVHIMESVTRGGMTNHCSPHAFFAFFVSNHSMEVVKPISYRSKAKSSSCCWFGERFPTVYFKTFPPRSCSTPLPIAEKDWWLPPDHVIWILNLNDPVVEVPQIPNNFCASVRPLSLILKDSTKTLPAKKSTNIRYYRPII